MNPGTDTRFVIPDAETRSRAGRHHNNAETIYKGRHSTDTRAAFTPGVGRHHVDDSLTKLIPPIRFTASVPLPARPEVRVEVPAAAVPVPAIEPVAPVTVGVLERVLRGLRSLRGRP
jgi:hypothetical protein